MENLNTEKDKIFSNLFDKLQPKKGIVSSLFFYIKNNNKQPPPLKDILSLDKDTLTPFANETLEFLEKEDPDNDRLKYSNFKWSILAFITIQDIFEATIFDETALKNMFQQWYFYYESKYVLTESILCWLNGFYNAENSLLRSFLEFNLLQLYFYRVAKQNSSYGTLNEYFKKGITPSWGKLINKSIPSDSFSRPIAMRLKFALDGLSKNSVHPYHPESSYKQYGIMQPGPCLEGLYFWVTVQLVLQPILWAYYANFPMLFAPVDIVRKFGFNGPVGIFIEKNQNIIIRNSLTESTYKEFENYAVNQEEAKTLISWYDSHKDLTETEIFNTWDYEHDGKVENAEQGYCLKIAKLRAMREAMSLEKHSQINLSERDEKILNSIADYSSWKRFLQNQNNKKHRS